MRKDGRGWDGKQLRFRGRIEEEEDEKEDEEEDEEKEGTNWDQMSSDVDRRSERTREGWESFRVGIESH